MTPTNAICKPHFSFSVVICNTIYLLPFLAVTLVVVVLALVVLPVVVLAVVVVVLVVVVMGVLPVFRDTNDKPLGPSESHRY